MRKILASRRRRSSYTLIGIIAVCAVVGLGLAFVFLWPDADLPEYELVAFRHEAMFFQEMADNKVQCQLCFLDCIIPDGHRGICRVRVNHAGRLYTLVHSRVVSWQVMPVEKDTMQHLLPGAKSFA
ncbi:hypothetical protein LR021_02615, partial [Candidatus Bipolaricaulota bacterium]|nr:hypothetical protein [Candidatus Bipolaricaulota bacterium]